MSYNSTERNCLYKYTDERLKNVAHKSSNGSLVFRRCTGLGGCSASLWYVSFYVVCAVCMELTYVMQGLHSKLVGSQIRRNRPSL